jgi:hypothetical protein
MPSRSSSEIVDRPRGIANRPSQEFGGDDIIVWSSIQQNIA